LQEENNKNDGDNRNGCSREIFAPQTVVLALDAVLEVV